jgi:transcriptional regulator with XRE-family HTH domain
MNGTTNVNSGARYVSTNLAAVLEAQGRMRRWLAERVGVSESLISKVLARTKTVDQALGERIADVLGVPFSVLFEFHERNTSDSRTERVS